MNDMNHENVGHNGEKIIIENHDKMKKILLKTFRVILYRVLNM